MVFHWSLSDSKSLQVSRTRLRILAVLSNAVVWIVSSRSPTSKSSRPFNTPLVIVPNAPITIGTIVTHMFYSFFNSLARSRYLSFFSLSFRFILWSAGTAKSTILQILFFLLIIFFHGYLSDNKSPWVSRTRLSILADFSNVVVWIVSILLLISNSSSFFSCLWEAFQVLQPQLVSLSPIYFDSQAKFKYLLIFSLSFIFIL